MSENHIYMGQWLRDYFYLTWHYIYFPFYIYIVNQDTGRKDVTFFIMYIIRALPKPLSQGKSHTKVEWVKKRELDKCEEGVINCDYKLIYKWTIMARCGSVSNVLEQTHYASLNHSKWSSVTDTNLSTNSPTSVRCVI